MNYNDYEIKDFKQERALSFGEESALLMRKVYLWMTLALVITGITAYGIATSPGLIYAILSNQALFWGLIIAEFVLVFAISGAINKMSITVATLLFVLYSVINGATLSVIFIAYTAESITNVFFITAATFGTMSLIGYTTKTDLSSMGKYLMMALIGVVIATIVNIFMGSSMLHMIISYVGVLVFVGLTAYDTQKIKNLLMEAPDAGEHMHKIALLGSLTLYLDFINLFIYLLRILGDRK
jgi:FtsH-binding integral membrane protein